MSSVTLKNVNKIYDNGFHAVHDVNIEIKDKEFIVLVGPSGCAKSTTLRMIAGLEDISSGELYIDDKLVNDIPPKDRDIAMVFQNYALYPHMNIYDNMSFGLKIRKMSKEEIDRRVKNAAEILGITDLLDRKPKQLSGGQRQRVAMGRAIVRDPKVFLMDEPLSNLDAKLRVQMRAELSKLHDRLETTMIYVTHDQVEAMTLADRIVVLKEGVIQQIADPITLYNEPANVFVAGFIGSPAMNFLTAKISKKDNNLAIVGNGFEIDIPHEVVNKFETISNYIGKEIVLGIRPENIIDPQINPAEDYNNLLTAEVDVIEPMGSEINLYLNIGEESIVAIVDPESKAQVGDKMEISFDLNKINLFDVESEKTIK